MPASQSEGKSQPVVPNTGARSAGRPRDERLDPTILTATRELLVERGYTAVSLAAIAERAGTTTAAIYRRWSGKPELIHEAIFPTAVSVPPPSTGDRRSDIRTMVDVARQVFSRPEVRVALPGVIADTTNNPELHAAMFGRLAAHFSDTSDHENAKLATGDLPQLAEAIAGIAMFHLLARPGAQLNATWAQSVTELLVNGWHPT
jgi:AcrR family transcriptional regulator